MNSMLKESDFFIVYNNYQNYSFGKELNILYLPLVGANAIKLYEFLFHKLLNDDNMTDKILHFNITESLAINLKQLLLARKKLEALGLIKSYYYDAEIEHRYVYEILKPLSFSEFLSNTLLSELLKNSIGDSEFELIKNKYPSNKVSFSVFTDVSARFSDLYDNHGSFDVSPERSSQGPNFSEYYFDFRSLNAILSSKYIDAILENSSLRGEILNLAHLYKVSVEDMAKGIENSLDRTSAGTEIDVKLLKEYLNQVYVNVRKQELPTLDNMINKQVLKETYSLDKELTPKEKVALELDNINYVDFLRRKHSIIISEIDSRNIVLKLQEKYKFPSGVLNVLLDYGIRNSNSAGLPSYNYFDKIASSWSTKRLLNALDAINFVNSDRQNFKQKAVQKVKNNVNSKPNSNLSFKNNRNRRKVDTPEYIKNQLKELINASSAGTKTEDFEDEYSQFLKERGIE